MNKPEEILAEKGYTVRYYYMHVSDAAVMDLNEEDGILPHETIRHPRVTVCLAILNGQLAARGVAICTLLDQPVKAIGREIAARRALGAVLAREDKYTRLSSIAALVLVTGEFQGGNPFIMANYPYSYPLGMYRPAPTSGEVVIALKSAPVEA